MHFMSGSLEIVVLIAQDKLKKFELYLLFVRWERQETILILIIHVAKMVVCDLVAKVRGKQTLVRRL